MAILTEPPKLSDERIAAFWSPGPTDFIYQAPPVQLFAPPDPPLPARLPQPPLTGAQKRRMSHKLRRQNRVEDRARRHDWREQKLLLAIAGCEALPVEARPTLTVDPARPLAAASFGDGTLRLFF